MVSSMRTKRGLVMLLVTLRASFAERVVDAPQIAPATDFLANWMGKLSPVTNTLLDLSLPGTHDTLTYDLSTENAFEMLGGLDKTPAIRSLLKAACSVLDGERLNCGNMVRGLAQSQGYNVTTQLNSGIRFLDLRTTIVKEFFDSSFKPGWYGVHGTATYQPALIYFRQIQDWLKRHPTELVVVFSTRHGSAGEGYAKVTTEMKQKYWADIKGIFGSMLLDSRKFTVGGSALGDILNAGMQVVWYQDDWAEFTNNDPLAIDAKQVNNRQAGEGFARSRTRWATQVYHDHRPIPDPSSQFVLFSQAAVISGDQMKDQILQYLHHLLLKTEQVNNAVPGQVVGITQDKCGELFVPNMSWCPGELMDQSLLFNYWTAFTLELTFNSDVMDFPHAIYIDAVTDSGHIRTGTERINDLSRWPDQFVQPLPSAKHAVSSYPYAATLIGKAVNRLCNQTNAKECEDLRSAISELRGSAPLTNWSDPTYGRWAEIPSDWIWTPPVVEPLT